MKSKTEGTTKGTRENESNRLVASITVEHTVNEQMNDSQTGEPRLLVT